MTDSSDRPRERLWRDGTSTLGDEELLAMLVGTGTRARSAYHVAAELVRAGHGIAQLSRSTPRELAQVSGVGTARATRIAAAFELGRRALEREHHRAVLSAPADVYALCGPRIAGLQQEVFLVIGLDVRNGLLDVTEVARGTVAGVEVHPREVFRPLIKCAAAGAVLVHNHPTGDPTPSHEDLELTRRLREVGLLLGIPVIDHVVIGDNSFRSIAEYAGLAPS